MILSIILILLLLAVAFFHYLQGFFSATLSAIIAAVSVLVAFTYYEPLVTMLNPGKFADHAHALVLISLFALTYIVLRLVFDLAVSGNVRMPSTLDKVGGAIMGLIAGSMAVGVVAVAAQALPFGPSIGGYSRYALLPEQPVGVHISAAQMADRHVYDEVKGYSISTTPDDRPIQHESLLLPVDDWVLGFVYHNSDGGSTAGGQPFAKIHPDYLQELFGNRIGIELGAKRSAQPIGGSDVVDVLGVYTVAQLPQADAEFDVLRPRTSAEEKLEKVLKADTNHVLLVVRVMFKLDATDADRLTRVSPGSVRLVTSVAADGKQTYREYFPIGTVDHGRQLMLSKPDDFLFLAPDKAADFLFLVDPAALPDMKVLPATIAADSEMFIEAKRYGRIPLAGKNIETLNDSDQVAVMRKALVLDKIASSNPEAVKKRMIGSWTVTASDATGDMTWKADGTWIAHFTMNGGVAMEASGKWVVISAGPDGLVFDRYVEGAPISTRFRVTFKDENNGSLFEVAKPTKLPVGLTRKP